MVQLSVVVAAAVVPDEVELPPHHISKCLLLPRLSRRKLACHCEDLGRVVVRAVAHAQRRPFANKETMRNRIVTALVFLPRQLMRVEVEVVVSAAVEDLLVVEAKPRR